jgi:hypothetical protein
MKKKVILKRRRIKYLLDRIHDLITQPFSDELLRKYKQKACSYLDIIGKLQPSLVEGRPLCFICS